MKDHDKALETYQEGLKHEPNSEELKEGVRRCMEHINKVDSVCKGCSLAILRYFLAASLSAACPLPLHMQHVQMAQLLPQVSCLALGGELASSPCLLAFTACRGECASAPDLHTSSI